VPILALLTLVIMIVALVDAITRRQDQVKHLPKFAWVIFIVMLPLLGSILWFALGREWSGGREAMSFGDPRRWSRDAATPASAPVQRPTDVRSTEEQMAALDREMEIAALEEQIRRRRAARDADPGASR
jgi:ABC-type molybdate transport system permease subunit